MARKENTINMLVGVDVAAVYRHSIIVAISALCVSSIIIFFVAHHHPAKNAIKSRN